STWSQPTRASRTGMGPSPLQCGCHTIASAICRNAWTFIRKQGQNRPRQFLWALTFIVTLLLQFARTSIIRGPNRGHRRATTLQPENAVKIYYLKPKNCFGGPEATGT